MPVSWSDDRYPPLLSAIADPPPVLWCRGAVDALSRPAVAIVGSRAATPYAQDVAAHLAAELAAAGLVVVSGLARGADGAAHRGCLSAGGATVAVLGCGPDVVYPPEHRELAASICRTGALVSELGPGGPPLPEHFPLRNRLISGISLAVVVVEASGTEWLAHHRPICPGAGPRRHGGAGQRAERPKPRLACAAEGRRKGRRECGRYLGGARLARAASPPAARAEEFS